MTKRNSENLSIADVLKEFIETNKLSAGLDVVNVKKAWHTVMGPGITTYTRGIKLEKDTLIVELSSSVLRQELSYGKEKIITLLNEELRKKLINKIILR